MVDHEITPDLVPYVNRYKWEQHLTDAQRYRLALYLVSGVTGRKTWCAWGQLE
ncbi:MAG: hypothetical protein AVDCRST_MAG93-5886 [uncultured Chloroflexia bacterium]|uniref:Uncharacterized protein n=1 Tax=uncultured Chloroflexia bacterium TaxID=1672391 RepID=A0A6J4L6C0_9CHLR|nr:MAG: hypothetical protein AVDCRST_MAG93-5886 [uncultured Chloroflexia bacterium]